MKKALLFLSSIFFSFNMTFCQSNEEFELILNELNSDSLKQTVVDLQAFPNRFSGTGNKDVAIYIKNRLQQYGISNATIDSFFVSTESWFAGSINRYMYNVIGELEGSTYPDSIVIIGAHLDAVSFGNNYSLLDSTAGADDNASGVAVMLEMARLFHYFNIIPKKTIHFMAYDGEEIGLFGSKHDSQKRLIDNEQIVVMLNNDMVANEASETNWELTLHWYDNAPELLSLASSFCESYTNLSPHIPVDDEIVLRQQSDSWSYVLNGYKALFCIEKNFSPYYHTILDVYTNCNFEYCKQVARLNFSLLYYYSTGFSSAGIEDQMPHYSLSLYPNPCYGQANLIFHLEENSPIYYVITDCSGKEIMQSKTMNYDSGTQIIPLSCETLPNGIYFCKLVTNKGYEVTKLIVQH